MWRNHLLCEVKPQKFLKKTNVLFLPFNKYVIYTYRRLKVMRLVKHWMSPFLEMHKFSCCLFVVSVVSLTTSSWQVLQGRSGSFICPSDNAISISLLSHNTIRDGQLACCILCCFYQPYAPHCSPVTVWDTRTSWMKGFFEYIYWIAYRALLESEHTKYWRNTIKSFKHNIWQWKHWKLKVIQIYKYAPMINMYLIV